MKRGAWQEIHGERKWSKDPAPLKIREVVLKERRYIVCLNEEERRKDAHDRQAIIAHLRDQLNPVPKRFVVKQPVSNRHQEAASSLSRKRGISRVHLDVELWLKNKKK